MVYLEEVKKGKPFEDDGVPQIEAKDCLFLPFTTVVRDNKPVTVVNMDPVMHDIQAYETSHLGARVLFNVPLPMNPQHPRSFRDRGDAALYHKHKAGAPKKELVMLSKDRRVFVMQCGFHAYMESWGLAVSNPYFAKTDEQGRFTITDVPPGTYKLVVWHPYIRTVNEQSVTVGPKGTTEADFAVLAPTGRLYVNEALEHDYMQYSVTEEQKKEIEPMSAARATTGPRVECRKRMVHILPSSPGTRRRLIVKDNETRDAGLKITCYTMLVIALLLTVACRCGVRGRFMSVIRSAPIRMSAQPAFSQCCDEPQSALK